MNTFTITSIPYYNSCNQCYYNILSINFEPQGPLRNFVRKINFPRLSAYNYDFPYNPIKKCGLVLTNFGYNRYNTNNNCCEYLKPDNIPELINFLLTNGYQIETQLTNMLQNSPVKINNDKLVLTATYYGKNQPNITYMR
jgi:hypothetical protein